VPPVEVERYEPTTDKTVPEPAPWMMRLMGLDAPLHEWERDPQKVSIELQDFFRHLGDPELGQLLDDAVQRATEEQMAEAREGVREMLGVVPHMAGAEHVHGIAGAFLFALAGVVGTVDWIKEEDGRPETESAMQ
jgi:hypothetical protein